MGDTLIAYQDSVDCMSSALSDSPLGNQRALRYEALAELFRFPECIPVGAIETILTSCPECPYRASAHMEAINEAGESARAWAENVRCGGESCGRTRAPVWHA